MYFNFSDIQNNDIEVLPLFSSICAQIKIENNYDHVLRDIKTNILFDKIDNKFGKNNHISKSKQILKKYDYLRLDIEKIWEFFKSSVLLHTQTDFSIVSSWATKFDSDSWCHLHGHCNSYYSGVFYLSDYESKFGGELFFDSIGVIPDQIIVENESSNIFNSREVKFAPLKNTVILFPSYLRHKVEHYTGKNTRYSIAFNILPKIIYQEGYDAPIKINC